MAEATDDFQRGWNAALLAARDWHEAKAKASARAVEAKPVPEGVGTRGGGAQTFSRDDRDAQS